MIKVYTGNVLEMKDKKESFISNAFIAKAGEKSDYTSDCRVPRTQKNRDPFHNVVLLSFYEGTKKVRIGEKRALHLTRNFPPNPLQAREFMFSGFEIAGANRKKEHWFLTKRSNSIEYLMTRHSLLIGEEPEELKALRKNIEEKKYPIKKIIVELEIFGGAKTFSQKAQLKLKKYLHYMFGGHYDKLKGKIWILDHSFAFGQSTKQWVYDTFRNTPIPYQLYPYNPERGITAIQIMRAQNRMLLNGKKGAKPQEGKYMSIKHFIKEKGEEAEKQEANRNQGKKKLPTSYTIEDWKKGIDEYGRDQEIQKRIRKEKKRTPYLRDFDAEQFARKGFSDDLLHKIFNEFLAYDQGYNLNSVLEGKIQETPDYISSEVFTASVEPDSYLQAEGKFRDRNKKSKSNQKILIDDANLEKISWAMTACLLCGGIGLLVKQQVKKHKKEKLKSTSAKRKLTGKKPKKHLRNKKKTKRKLKPS